MPGRSAGTWVAPRVSQFGVRRTTIASGPARSLPKESTVRPSLTVACDSDQPVGSVRTQGTIEAEGTDCASSHNGSRSVQLRLPAFSGVLRDSLLVTLLTIIP